jgi:polyisoprenoid-binding protein YceI
MTVPTATTPDLQTLTGSWTLDPSRTTITFTTKAMWVLPVRAGATAVEGSAVVGGDGSVRGSLVVDAASIDTGNKKRDAHLRTEDFFEVSTYPTFVVTVLGATPATAGTYELDATLALHGQEHPLPLPASVTVDADGVTVQVETVIDRSRWGLTWTKLGAGLLNHVVVSARFTKE